MGTLGAIFLSKRDGDGAGMGTARWPGHPAEVCQPGKSIRRIRNRNPSRLCKSPTRLFSLHGYAACLKGKPFSLLCQQLAFSLPLLALRSVSRETQSQRLQHVMQAMPESFQKERVLNRGLKLLRAIPPMATAIAQRKRRRPAAETRLWRSGIGVWCGTPSFDIVFSVLLSGCHPLFELNFSV